jgi:hypothetical protein
MLLVNWFMKTINVDSQLSNLNISTSDLEKGVYFVSVTQNNQAYTKKLVVQ